jgi:hypothetical protein
VLWEATKAVDLIKTGLGGVVFSHVHEGW